ncbi:MAG TPA: SRPBCC family protein, partial [Solirubrobacteraceae bacterium]|nr:SRPBCC family protein [Solirubrobacteraceae bacterium]
MTGIEGTEQINAVTRRVGSGEFRAGEARMVTIGRRYDAAIEDVWDACTNPERIPRWFLPVSGELREGGRYQVQGNAGGVIERCEPPRGFAATWEFGGQVSWIELRLSEATGGGTRFELEHIAHVSDHWAQFG